MATEIEWKCCCVLDFVLIKFHFYLVMLASNQNTRPSQNYYLENQTMRIQKIKTKLEKSTSNSCGLRLAWSTFLKPNSECQLSIHM
jgi:hypothetical protein